MIDLPCYSSPIVTGIVYGVITFLILATLALLLFIFRNSMSVFTPARNSVWEYLKLIYWPALLVGLVIYSVWQPVNFVTAWVVSIMVAMYYYVSSYYTYVGVFGYDSLYIDVSVYVYSIAFGIATYYFTQRSSYHSPFLTVFSLIVLVGFGIAFCVLTYNYPSWGIFSYTD
jgi:hypothetical protein